MHPILVLAFNPGPMTGPGNSTWLLTGRVSTLIDAGTGDPRHLDALEQALGGVRLDRVLVTHGHVDHASGAPTLARRMPHLRFFKMPWARRDAAWDVRWEPLADTDVIAAGDSALRVVHTPGHAPDHVCFWSEDDRQLFCGDLAWKGSTVMIPPSEGGDVAQYLDSLARVIALAPARMLPAHGPIIDEPEALLREYIEHRRLREQQVIDALRADLTHVEAIVSRIYPTLGAPLVPMATQSVLAHLLKLEREGKARRGHDAWHIIAP